MERDEKIRILIVSNASWNDNNNFGNSFSNIFGGESRYEIANIYCDNDFPNNKVVSYHFRITEKSILRYIFRKQKTSGEKVENTPFSIGTRDGATMGVIKRLRWTIFFWLRDLIWLTGLWRSKELDRFIDDFNPDIIFQPIYYFPHINRIAVYAAERLNIPMLGYMVDDNYSLRQYSWSPLFWIDRIIKRRTIKKVVDRCKLLYVITETQRKEFDGYFGQGKCKVLYKGGEFLSIPPEYKENKLLEFLYTGNLGDGRWETIAEIASCIAKINANGQVAKLDIYSATNLSKEAMSKLNIEGGSEFKGVIPSALVKPLQRKADILIHVESFKKSKRYISRLSMSTKIVDYMEAGRCILAVGWEETGGIEYLRSNDAAMTVVNITDLYTSIDCLIKDYDLRREYARKSYELGRQNHRLPVIRKMLWDDIVMFSKKNID